MKKVINNLVYNQPHLKAIRRNLRKQEISAERIFWSRVRNKQQGYKFKRQFSIGNYILDFYCPKLKLGIEIDGATHGDEFEIKRDAEKEKFISRFGIKIIRFLNTDIFEDIDSVLEELNYQCRKREDKIKAQLKSDPLLISPLARGRR